MRSFLLTFDDQATPRDFMVHLVNALDGVADWLAFLPGAIVLISPHTAHELAVALNTKRPGMSFLITEIDQRRADGRLPAPVWNFINNPDNPHLRRLQPAMAG